MRDFFRFSFAALAVTAVALVVAAAANPALAQTGQQPAPVRQAAPPPPQPAPPALTQIELTEKQIEQLLAAQKDMDAITDKLPESAGDKPDPKLQAQLEGIAKKNGFAGFDEYGTVYDNVSLVMSGIDPKTRSFIEPPEALKKQIAAVQADAKIPAKEKKEMLDDMNAALKTLEPVKYPGNVALVTKYYDRLSALMMDDE